MMNKFGRWRELAFPPWFFQPLEVWVQLIATTTLQETHLHVGWEMEGDLQPLFVLGQVSLVLLFFEV